MLHHLEPSPNNVHWGYYDAKIPPVLHINSGDSVEVNTFSGDPKRLSNNGLNDKYIQLALKKIHDEVNDRGPGKHILFGPIFVKNAKPGDVLEVRFKKITPSVSFGYNHFLPNSGTLPDDYPYSKIKIIKFHQKNNEYSANFTKNIEIPLQPFFGQLGVAPALEQGRINSSPPGSHGGNLDNKELVQGSTLYLPVHVDGALFSIGDGHAIQGDGEVSISALETCMNGIIELNLRKDLILNWPMAETHSHLISMGLNSDLFEASKMAVRNMIDYLTRYQNVNRDDAYHLSSVALDLHVTQIVDGVKGVHGILPKNIFKSHSRWL